MANAADYVRKALAKGLGEGEIRADLLGIGLTEPEIQTAFSEARLNPEPVQPQSKKSTPRQIQNPPTQPKVPGQKPNTKRPFVVWAYAFWTVLGIISSLMDGLRYIALSQSMGSTYSGFYSFLGIVTLLFTIPNGIFIYLFFMMRKSCLKWLYIGLGLSSLPLLYIGSWVWLLLSLVIGWIVWDYVAHKKIGDTLLFT
jgi:hypothetical protein